MKLTVSEAAIRVLNRTGNSAVMWGDSGLLHEIAEELGWPHQAWKTEDRVMAALNKTPGKLAKGKAVVGGRVVSIFRLKVGLHLESGDGSCQTSADR